MTQPSRRGNVSISMVPQIIMGIRDLVESKDAWHFQCLLVKCHELHEIREDDSHFQSLFVSFYFIKHLICEG